MIITRPEQSACVALALLTLHVHADTTEAVGDSFQIDNRDSQGSVEAASLLYGFDARNLGNNDSEASGGFALNTFGTIPTGLDIVGPVTVGSGSATDYQVRWNQGGSSLDVTAGARWRFLGSAPGNTGMVPPTLYAGQTAIPAAITLVASYLGPGGVSLETPPFQVTVLPVLGVSAGAVRGNGGEVTYSATSQNGSGEVTVRWDLDGDGAFDDAVGNSVTRDYGTWTGSTRVSVEVTDAAGNRRVEQRDIVINKPPVPNQPVMEKPAYDPGGFKLGLASTGAVPDPFQFNAGGVDRRSNGLVVIAHGLYADYSAAWMKDMAAAVQNRARREGLPNPPNIALLDWSELAKDPSELPEEQKALLQKLVEKGIKDGNVKALGTGLAGYGINIAFDAYYVREFGLITGQQLANWVYLNGTRGATPQIDVERPIHFIGHSAGGFVVGEAARILKHMQVSPVTVDRVTMLDTPFPLANHLATGGKNYANPGVVDRVVSSSFGSFEMPFVDYPLQNAFYRKTILGSFFNPFTTYSPGDSGHGNSHVWYRETIWQENYSSDGFSLSPIINAATRVMKGSSPAPFAKKFQQASAMQATGLPDVVLSGWEVFGNATENEGEWTFKEHADAGIWKDINLPVETTSLAFDFQFSSAGDGDFLAVHFGDLPVLYQGLDLELSQDGWVPVEIPLDVVGETDGRLVFTLVSRGAVNAQLKVRDIRVTLSDDPDGDGLDVSQEAALGTNPRSGDTDKDGLTDGDEVNVYLTDPLHADTDGDGQDDAAELTAGTDPRQSGSYLRISNTTRESGGSVRIGWATVVGKRYRVLRTEELGTGNYEVLATDIPGVAGTKEFVDTNPPAVRAFYWIQVE